MAKFKLSEQGTKLIEQYQIMARDGFKRTNGSSVPAETAYNSFQLKKFRHVCLDYFKNNDIKTVLDYGGGGSDWKASNFDKKSAMSAQDFFNVSSVTTFEPARNLNQKTISDCVVCIDVLEHIFIGDIAKVINELFSLAKKLLIINVACYPATALLPCGENAHITLRSPDWWKGTVDTISASYPGVEILLICSTRFDQGVIFESHKFKNWLRSETFEVQVKLQKFSM